MPKTQLMGIINATPDSFFCESRSMDLEVLIQRGITMAAEGADILDIGGEATSQAVYNQEIKEDCAPALDSEIQRVIPLIQALKDKVDIPLSLDTRKAKVAQLGVEAGASIINDQDGFRDPAMREVAAGCTAKLVVMHMQGTPATMQIDPQYPEGVVPEVKRWLSGQVELLLQAGVSADRIILDPGICFGKTLEQNYELLAALPELKALGFPVLVGISRKSLLRKIVHQPAAELLPGTLALNTRLIDAGVDIIRVHDVPAHRQVIDLLAGIGRLQADRPKARLSS